MAAKSRGKRPIPERGAAKSAAYSADTTAKAVCDETPKTGGTMDSCTVERPDDSFAEALVMLGRLQLTDAERAEAVRRLLTRANAACESRSAPSPGDEA